MHMLKRLVLIFFVLAVASAGTLAIAQEQSVAEGQLVRLDPAAKKLVIKTEAGAQMQFEYTPSTVVNGADQSVEGLGQQAGTVVTVQYEKQETRLLAVQIDVHQK